MSLPGSWCGSLFRTPQLSWCSDLGYFRNWAGGGGLIEGSEKEAARGWGAPGDGVDPMQPWQCWDQLVWAANAAYKNCSRLGQLCCCCHVVPALRLRAVPDSTGWLIQPSRQCLQGESFSQSMSAYRARQSEVESQTSGSPDGPSQITLAPSLVIYYNCQTTDGKLRHGRITVMFPELCGHFMSNDFNRN